MTDKKTTDEDAAGTLTGTEIVGIVQGGANKRTTLAAVAALATGGTGGPSLDVLLAGPSKAMRRSITGPRNDNTVTLAAAYRIYEAAKKTNTDGSLTVWEPDGVSFYGAMWARDTAMSMEAYPEYFTPAQISAVLTYYLSKSNFTTGEVPDHILHDGTVKMHPGTSGTGYGVRAPIDGQMMLVQMAWVHYLSTGSATLYDTNKVHLKALIETGVNYNGSTKAVNIPNGSSYVGFGFYDSCEITGDNAFCSVLAYRAFIMLAEMEHALGNDTEALRLFNRAQDLKGAVQAMLTIRAGTGGELASPYFAKQMAYLFAGTVKGATQIDLWATSYAVWNGMLTPAQDKMVGNFLLYAYSSTGDNVNVGGIRHVYKPTDFTANSACWEAHFGEAVPTYGTYQNGGYWPTATPWVVNAISKVSPYDALKLYSEFITGTVAKGADAPLEWWNTGFANIGAKQYLTSAAAYFEVGDAPFKQAVASGGGGGAGITWGTHMSNGAGDVNIATGVTYTDSTLGSASVAAIVGDTVTLSIMGSAYNVSGGGQNHVALCLNGVPVYEFLYFCDTAVTPTPLTFEIDRVIQSGDLSTGIAVFTVQTKSTGGGGFRFCNTAPSAVQFKITNFGQ